MLYVKEVKMKSNAEVFYFSLVLTSVLISGIYFMNIVEKGLSIIF